MQPSRPTTDVVISDAAPRIHTNAMAAVGGPFDLTMEFGYRAHPDKDPEAQVVVTTSWEHAREMAIALTRMVEQYEKKVGKLPQLPQDDQEGIS